MPDFHRGVSQYRGLTLLMRASTRWPIVMREGMAWGLMIKSGTIPSAVQGMSSCVYVMPTVPFWPCRLANLSPTWGILIERTCPNQALLSPHSSQSLDKANFLNTGNIRRMINFLPFKHEAVLVLMKNGSPYSGYNSKLNRDQLSATVSKGFSWPNPD